MLEFNQNHKSIQIPFVIHVTMEFLLEKTSSCDTDPTKSLTSKLNKHTASGYSLFTNSLFDNSKTKIIFTEM